MAAHVSLLLSLMNSPWESWTQNTFIFLPCYNQTAPWNIFTLRHVEVDEIPNAASAAPGSDNLIIFEYQRGKRPIIFLWLLIWDRNGIQSCSLKAYFYLFATLFKLKNTYRRQNNKKELGRFILFSLFSHTGFLSAAGTFWEKWILKSSDLLFLPSDVLRLLFLFWIYIRTVF